VHRWGVGYLAATEEFFDSQANVASDLPEQGGGYVPAGMKGDRGAAAVWMAELLVGAALADFDEAERFPEGRNFPWFQHRDGRHSYATCRV
jgi:hypothetical protein